MKYNILVKLDKVWNTLAEDIDLDEVNELKKAHPTWVFDIVKAG